MPETISTPNLVALPVTSQELDRRGGALLPSPTKIGLSNSPTTIGLKSNSALCNSRSIPVIRRISHWLYDC